MSHEVLRGVAWPYPDDQFPQHLGVVVQRTVADGTEPARAVVHDADGDWLVADGVSDPNGNSILICMEHLTASDPTIAALAAMAPGTEAWREQPDRSWQFEAHQYSEEA
ncbi:hypothetical protein R8Z50_09090 [Longispora sp. K20-0274]|uniref:hypothetical protein n=1 Tax=Longispora sp. K20-0274 TaxID=3088255 RepID=UPI00399B5510